MTCRFYLIDDDPGAVRMLERIIIDQELGTVAGKAADGFAGAEGVLQQQPDIVIIDLLMPRRDGLETMASLRREGYRGSFVVLSRVTDKAVVERAYRAGVRFFIHKPLNLVEIRSVLRQVAETLELEHTLHALRSGLRTLYETGEPPREPAPAGGLPGAVPTGSGTAAAGVPRAAGMAAVPAARRILTDLGILGETGSDDLLAIALLPLARDPVQRGALELQQLYAHLARYYMEQGTRGKSCEPKAIEQRLRRAASLALRQVAALGLEDYGDPRFERLASTFFEFEEVRVEMARLRRGGPGPSGHISLKRFMEAFFWMLDDAGAR